MCNLQEKSRDPSCGSEEHLMNADAAALCDNR